VLLIGIRSGGWFDDGPCVGASSIKVLPPSQ